VEEKEENVFYVECIAMQSADLLSRSWVYIAGSEVYTKLSVKSEVHSLTFTHIDVGYVYKD